MTIQILCINKDNGNHENPHEAIQYFGWSEQMNSQNNGRSSMQQLIAFLEKNGNQAYVLSGVNKAYCFVNRSRFGNKFVQTHSDGTPDDNLLHLPECSPVN